MINFIQSQRLKIWNTQPISYVMPLLPLTLCGCCPWETRVAKIISIREEAKKLEWRNSRCGMTSHLNRRVRLVYTHPLGHSAFLASWYKTT
jgi:hypothetical protein